MDAIILNIFEINYSQLIQYEILEKLVTCMDMVKNDQTYNGKVDTNFLISFFTL